MPCGPILITGFEPFASMTRNPSASVVETIAAGAKDWPLVIDVLPVEYGKAQQRIEQLIRQHSPAAWIGFGLHQRATAIRLETVAFNLDDTSLPDNAGELRQGVPINPAGPAAYQTTLPLDAISDELNSLQIEHALSDSAGRFVCNHVFYHAMHVTADGNRTSLAGFIHLPWPSDWQPVPPVSHNVTFMTQMLAARAIMAVVLRQLPT
jgi:pyroglutamyl-peptidase